VRPPGKPCHRPALPGHHPHALCDLTGVAISYPRHGGATVHATPGTTYNSGGFRLTVHPGTVDVTVEVQLRPGESRP
jgi:hypothetical protein